MAIKWRDGTSPSGILDSINDISSVDRDGNVTYKNAFAYNEYLSILEEMVDIVDVDNEHVKRDLMRKAISNLVKKNIKINKDAFSSQISNNINYYKKRKIKNYYMLGEISIRSTCLMKSKRIYSSSISIKSYKKHIPFGKRKYIT